MSDETRLAAEGSTDMGGDYVPADLDLQQVRSPRMRSLVVGLWRLHKGPDGLSVPEIRRAAHVAMADATLRRCMDCTTASLRQEQPEWTPDLIKLERFVEERRFGDRGLGPMPRKFDELLDVEESEIYEPIARQLAISEARVGLTRRSAPGWYLGICFSTSLPNRFVIYLVHMKEKRRGVSYLEYHINRTTGVPEVYTGFIFGKSESHCILCIESTQNLIRSYVQTDRLPNRGPISWMKGHVIATGVAQGGFVSPFYLERIHPAFALANSTEQPELVSNPETEQKMARVIFGRYLDIVPLSNIGDLVRSVDLLGPPPKDANDDQILEYEAEKFVGRFAAHAIVHISDLRQEVERSYSRLEIERDHVHRLKNSV